MLIDLVQIRRQGERKAPENQRFRKYLRTHRVDDRKLRHIAEDVEDEIDCTVCANCCRVATAPLQKRDIEKLAKYLGLSVQRFVDEYAELSEEEGLILKRTEQGCTFLHGNTCSVYDVRPGTCVNFPHLVRGNGSLPSRMWQFVDRASYCPIVYNTLESWKETTKFEK
jgi:uncharacterized protein